MKNICESCIHSMESDVSENRVGEFIYYLYCDKMNKSGCVYAAVSPHVECPHFKPRNTKTVRQSTGKYSR